MLLSPDVGYRDRCIRIVCGFLHTGQQWKGRPEGWCITNGTREMMRETMGLFKSIAMRYKWSG